MIRRGSRPRRAVDPQCLVDAGNKEQQADLGIGHDI
jgi:hypothetical protein